MTSAQVAQAVFDSHRFVKRLTEAGMAEGLAEVLAEEHMGPWIRNVATKADVAAVRRDLGGAKEEIAALRKDLETFEVNIRREFATKADVVNAVAAAERRLMVAIIGVAGLLFAALRLSQ